MPELMPDRSEEQYRSWYRNWASRLGMDQNPDDPRHHYKFREAYDSGLRRPTPYGIPHGNLAEYPGIDRWFRANPNVAGLAAAPWSVPGWQEDEKVFVNPYSGRSPEELKLVAENEYARLLMRKLNMQPKFSLTPSQQSSFSGYGDETAQRETLAGRLLTGDPSALDATPEQQTYVNALSRKMNYHWPSQFKALDHPNRFLQSERGLYDTINNTYSEPTMMPDRYDRLMRLPE
jgi:hypothetical protein